ncbi:T9SS type A sorting domain-containing protein [bacterium]|nr:T9SS type A sorting domain-containing protein [bacterium]
MPTAQASTIGIFADLAATLCSVDMDQQYTVVTVHYIAVLDDVAAMSACEFGATGVSLAGQAIATVSWNTTLVIGDIMTPDGVALAFTTPLHAPLAYLGSISYFLLAPIDEDHLMHIVPSGAGNIVVVDADTGVEIPAMGWGFVVNCDYGGQYEDCSCYPNPPATYTHVSITSPFNGSPLEGTFSLHFNVRSHIGYADAPFTGQVFQDGAFVEEFDGEGDDTFVRTQSTEGEPHGSTHSISVHAENAESDDDESITYTIVDTTPPIASLDFPPDEYQFNGDTLPLQAGASDFQGSIGMTAEFYREEAGSTGPTTSPIAVVAADDGIFASTYDASGENSPAFDIGVVVIDAAGNRSPYQAHTVYVYPLDYRVTIDVDSPVAHDWGAIAGARFGATDGYDPDLDLPEPPTPPNTYVSCYFPHPEWDSPFGDRFNADIREDTDFQGLQKRWDFTVETDLLNQPFTLSFTADPAFIDSLPTFVIDLDEGSYYNLREQQAFAIDSGEAGVRHFQLQIGPSEALPGAVAADFAAGWNLVSLPLLPPDLGAGAIFGDDIQGSYFLYGFTESTGYLPTSLLDFGRGYWLGLLTDATVDVAGSAQVDTVATHLGEPWQMVGTGLYKNLALSQARVRREGLVLPFDEAVQAGWVSPAVYGWDPALRAYSVADTLELWRGYWIGQLVDGVDLLTHKDWGYIPIEEQPDPETGWQIGLTASGAGATDAIRLGMHPQAAGGFDVPFDYPKPPIAPAGAPLYLSFPHPEWRCVLGSQFGRDIRVHDDGVTTWTLRLVSELQDASLSWPYWDHGVPDDLDVVLDNLDTPEDERIDMRHQASYDVTGAGTHRFSVRVGRGIVTATEPELPAANAILGSHPNPFNPATTIAFSVREDAAVKLEVFSLDGRKVATLVDARLDAGLHESVWQGRDSGGARVSSGVYLARLQIAGDVLTSKLVLLK